NYGNGNLYSLEFWFTFNSSLYCRGCYSSSVISTSRCRTSSSTLLCILFWSDVKRKPPVALAAYTGAGIAKADPVKTSWTALRLALPGFIIPFLLVYHPELLLNDATTGGLNYGQLIVTILISLVGIYALVTGMGNYLFTKLNILERILFIVFAVMLIFPDIITSIVGIIGVILLMSVHYIKFRKVGVT